MLHQQITDWLRSLPNDRASRQLDGVGIYLSTDTGLTRRENQDRLSVMRFHTGSKESKEFLCVAVSDGMGGMRNGAECASQAIGAFFSSLVVNHRDIPPQRLANAVHRANEVVYEYAAGKGGATLSAVLIEGNSDIFHVNVGDSRIYTRVKSEEVGTELVRITIDDNMREAFGGTGEELVQFIGLGKGLVPHVGVVASSVETVVITTDGVHFIPEGLMREISRHANGPKVFSERLVALARWLGSPDNASIAAFDTRALSAPTPYKGGLKLTLWSPVDTLHIFQWSGDLDPKPTKSSPIPDNPGAHRKRSTRQRRETRREEALKASQLKIDVDVSGSADGNDRE